MLLDMETKPKVLTERYELGRLLGQGTFAKVYYARTLRTNESVAIKVIDKEKVLKAGLMEQIKREIAVMKLVRHPNVLELYEVMATKSKIYFVMEYAKGGELFSKVAKGKLEEDVAWEYFRQLLDAVDFCHSKGVYHRDIKPENLLLDDDENLKVSDFGLSAIAESKRHDGLLHTTCGSPAYVAPEVIGRRGYDGAKADIWSCGVVLFVLMAGYLPFHDSNLMEMYKKIWRGEFNCPNWFPSGVRRLLKRIFDPNPETRISIAKIRESSWFRKKLLAKYGKSVTPSIYVASTDADAPDLVQKSCMAAGEMVKPPCLNAFDIISLSAGFDLSGFFVDNSQKRETRFTSRQPATVIISKLEEICKRIKFSVKKKVDGLLRLERIKDGQKGNLTIDAEIFEITPSLNLIEIKISDGDVQEYHRVLNDIIRPALRDIVWAWQGEQEQVAQMMQQELSDSLPRQPLFQLQQQEPLIMNQ